MPIIQVDNVSMRFNLAQEKTETLKEIEEVTFSSMSSVKICSSPEKRFLFLRKSFLE